MRRLMLARTRQLGGVSYGRGLPKTACQVMMAVESCPPHPPDVGPVLSIHESLVTVIEQSFCIVETVRAPGGFTQYKIQFQVRFMMNKIDLAFYKLFGTGKNRIS